MPRKYRPGAASERRAARSASRLADIGAAITVVGTEPGGPDDVRDVERPAVAQFGHALPYVDRLRDFALHARPAEIPAPAAQERRPARAQDRATLRPMGVRGSAPALT